MNCARCTRVLGSYAPVISVGQDSYVTKRWRVCMNCANDTIELLTLWLDIDTWRSEAISQIERALKEKGP